MANGVNDSAGADYGAGNGFCIANIRPDGFETLVVAPED
jgi:hypothetical protein